MRILYFTRDYTTHDRRFLSALAKTEHEVHYLRLEQRGHQLEDRPLPPEIHIVPWAGGKQPFEWREGLRLLADLKRVLAQVKPDILHAGPIQTSALLAALTGFRPLVSMSWGSDLLVDAERDSWYRWATRYVMKHSAAFVGDCAPVRQKAIAFGMPDERIVTFPWGVELGPFAGAQPPAPTKPVCTLLSTRSWEPVYGVDVIARAFVLASRQLGQTRPLPLEERGQDSSARTLQQPALRLVMLGNGSQAGLLRQIFSQGGVEDQVLMPGQATQAELLRYFQMADLYVAASHSDGTSISLLEAMASARPVLVSDIPGNREWVTPGEQGWLFPDGNPQALAEGILRAVQDRQALVEMGRRARHTAETRANWEKNFPQLLTAYHMARQQSLTKKEGRR